LIITTSGLMRIKNPLSSHIHAMALIKPVPG